MRDNDARILSEAYVNMFTEKALTPDQIAKNAQPAGSSGKKGEALPKNKTEDKTVEKTLAEVPYTDQDPENFDQDGKDTEVKDRYVVKENQIPTPNKHIEGADADASILLFKFKQLPPQQQQRLISDLLGKTQNYSKPSASSSNTETDVMKESNAVADFYGVKKKVVKVLKEDGNLPIHKEYTPTIKSVDEYVDIVITEFTEALQTIEDELTSEVGPEHTAQARVLIAVAIKRITNDFTYGRLPPLEDNGEQDDPHPREIDDTPAVPPATEQDRDVSGIDG